MCNANCCCRNESTNGLIRLLLIFTAVNLIFSFAAIFIRAANTKRYDRALEYLEAINNGTFNNITYEDCKKSGYIFKDGYYCKINGEYLKKPSDTVSNQSLFKNWTKAELAINIIRTVLTLIFISFLYFVIKNKGSNIQSMDNDERKKYSSNLFYLLFFTSLMITYSGLCIIIRALALTPNMDIGLYPDTDQDAFESKIAVNYIIDIIEIVLYSIEICFIIRIKRIAERPPIQTQITNPRNQQLAPISAQPPQTISVPQPMVQGVAITREVRITAQINTGDRIHPLDNF